MSGQVASALLLQLAALGCPVALPENQRVAYHCADSKQCPTGQLCVAERCVAVSTIDASHNADAFTDATVSSDRRFADRTPADRAAVDAARADAESADHGPTDRSADHAALDQFAIDASAGDAHVGDATAFDQTITDSPLADQAAPDVTAADQTPVNPCTLANAVAIHATAAIAIDTQSNDWTDACFQDIDTTSNWGPDGSPGPADFASLRAHLAVQWKSDALYFWVEVTDDVQHNDQDAALIWNGDSVQVGLDLDCSGGDQYAAGDFEFGWALASNLQRSYRWYPDYSSPALSFLVQRNDSGGRTFYEAVLTSADLGGRSFAAGNTICLSLVANEADSGDRIGWLEWGSGVAESGKFPRLFQPMLLAP